MRLTSCYPVLLVSQVATAQQFFQDHFDFEPTFTADWYVSLRHRHNPAFELAVLDPTHETIPAAHRGRTTHGMLINIEVEDVDAMWQRLVLDAGLDPLLEIRTEDFGQRHFIVAGPEGVLIDVITPIAPAAAYAGSFTAAATP